MMNKESTLKEDLDFITDVFSGGDGGVSFFLVKARLMEIDLRGDEVSRELIAKVRQFRKLLEILGDHTIK
jgi:hypothetical protein